MRIAAISDLHGQLPVIKECDILCISGDICPHFGKRVGSSDDIFGQMKWLLGPFDEWLKSLPVKHVVATFGNHDWIAQKSPHMLPKLDWHLLMDDVKTIEGIKFYGSPWQLWYHDWAFNAPYGPEGEEFLARKYRNIPDDVDIIISHGPPQMGYLDMTSKERTGSTALTYKIETLKPLLTVCGHIHSGYGVHQHSENVLVCNASVLDEAYELTNEPLYFDIDLETRTIKEVK